MSLSVVPQILVKSNGQIRVKGTGGAIIKR